MMTENAAADAMTVYRTAFYGVVRVALVMACVNALCISAAYAQSGSTPMQDVICTLVDWFSGNLGEGLATIGVSAVAVGAIFGKVSWGLALTVITGIAVMFKAESLLESMGAISGGVCP